MGSKIKTRQGPAHKSANQATIGSSLPLVVLKVKQRWSGVKRRRHERGLLKSGGPKQLPLSYEHDIYKLQHVVGVRTIKKAASAETDRSVRSVAGMLSSSLTKTLSPACQRRI